MGDPYESAWWEWFRKTHPESYQDLEDFFQIHQNDPDFKIDNTETGWSDRIINEFADFCLSRIQERSKVNKYPRKVGLQGGQEEITTT